MSIKSAFVAVTAHFYLLIDYCEYCVVYSSAAIIAVLVSEIGSSFGLVIWGSTPVYRLRQLFNLACRCVPCALQGDVTNNYAP